MDSKFNKRWYTFARIPLYFQILIGMIAGILLGIVAVSFSFETGIDRWIRPWGTLFIRMLQLTAIPLVFLSLVKGVSSLHDIGKISKMGFKTVGIYILTTIVAIIFGLLVGNFVKPGKLIGSSQLIQVETSQQFNVQDRFAQSGNLLQESPLNFLFDIVPDNMLGAMSSNGKMLQVIFLAVLLSIAMLSIGAKKSDPVLKIINSLYDIVLRMVDFIIKLAPYGVAALMAGLVCSFSANGTLFLALGTYMLTVIFSLLALIFLFYPLLIRLFSSIKPSFFLSKIYPVQLLAFSTSSSAATLPLALETAERDLKISPQVSSFVLPVGVTINMDGTSLFQTLSVLFIAQALGIELSFMQMGIVLLTTTLSSIGTPAIPGGSYVILTMVLTSVGIPAEGLALILGVDRPLDMLRTAVNVTGDMAVAVLVDDDKRKKKEVPKLQD